MMNEFLYYVNVDVFRGSVLSCVQENCLGILDEYTNNPKNTHIVHGETHNDNIFSQNAMLMCRHMCFFLE